MLAEIETDKATLGFEAADEGVLAKILVQSGAKNIEIGTPVAIVVDDESHVAKFANYTLGLWFCCIVCFVIVWLEKERF